MPAINNLLHNIQTIVVAAAGTVFIICIVIAGIMRMVSFGNERRVALSNMALTAAVVGLIIILLAVAVGQFLLKAIPGGPGVTIP